MNNYSNKNVWVTGASSGIGEAIAYQFAGEGSNLVISGRDENRLKAVKDKCITLGSPNVHIIAFDLAQREEVMTACKEALSTFDHIDVYVHGGGISQRSKVADTSEEVMRKVFEINYFSSNLITKALLPKMLSHNYGQFILISSLVGKFGTPLRSSYSASKHALHGFYESLRAEVYDNNIGVTIACPGYIKTNISINAVTGDGGSHSIMDDNQARGMTADKCAELIIKAARKRKSEVFIGGKEVLGFYIKRFFPKLMEKIVRNVNVGKGEAIEP